MILSDSIYMAGSNATFRMSVESLGYLSRLTVTYSPISESEAFLFSPMRATRAMVLLRHSGVDRPFVRAGNQSLHCLTALTRRIASH